MFVANENDLLVALASAVTLGYVDLVGGTTDASMSDGPMAVAFALGERLPGLLVD